MKKDNRHIENENIPTTPQSRVDWALLRKTV